jgi:hypothetical protein
MASMIRLAVLLVCALAAIIWIVGAFPRRLLRRAGFKALTVVLAVIWVAAIVSVIARL